MFSPSFIFLSVFGIIAVAILSLGAAFALIGVGTSVLRGLIKRRYPQWPDGMRARTVWRFERARVPASYVLDLWHGDHLATAMGVEALKTDIILAHSDNVPSEWARALLVHGRQNAPQEALSDDLSDRG